MKKILSKSLLGTVFFLIAMATSQCESQTPHVAFATQLQQPLLLQQPLQSQPILNLGHGIPTLGSGCQATPNQCPSGCGSNGSCVAHPWDCSVRVYGKGICHNNTTTPIHVNPPNECDSFSETVSFYCGEQHSEGLAIVPTCVKSSIEKFRFEKKSFEICGCKLEICVPCAKDNYDKEECRPQKKKLKMVARIRTSNSPKKTADIWVFNVKGYPDKAVLALNIDSQTANQRFGTTFSY